MVKIISKHYVGLFDNYDASSEKANTIESSKIQ